MTVFRLRPHHGLCLLHFVGKGYSHSFSANMLQIAECLQGEPNTSIELCTGADSLCAYCPHRKGNICESEKSERYDHAVLQCGGLQIHRKLVWKDFRERMSALSRENLRTICGDCEWYPLCAAIEINRT